jgi:hypothetical protein
MAKNIEKIYSDIFKLREDLEDILEKAKDIANESKDFQGMINNVLTEQFVKYFIPGITKYITDIKTPGSISGVVKFLDAVPLAYTRDKENASPIDPIIPENSTIEAPSGSSIQSNVSNDIDDIPLNTSYNKPQGTPAPQPPIPTGTSEVPEESSVEEDFAESKKVEENRITEKASSWVVIRKSSIKSALGDKFSTTNRKNVVYESACKEKAEAKAEYLNSTVLPDEQEFLGTEYIVEEKDKD